LCFKHISPKPTQVVAIEQSYNAKESRSSKTNDSIKKIFVQETVKKNTIKVRASLEHHQTVNV